MGRVKISTDGAQVRGSNMGGWGVVIRSDDEVETLSDGETGTTNNRMELRAILEGLKYMPDGESVLIRSDSKYALGVSNGSYDASTNLDLVNAIREEADRLNVEWTHVKGHSGDPDNERADDLAEEEAQQKIEEASDDHAPFIVKGNTYPVKDELQRCGMSWEPRQGVYRAWYREEWEEAVKEVGAEIQSENVAVI